MPGERVLRPPRRAQRRRHPLLRVLVLPVLVLDRFLDPVGSFLTPEVARRLVRFRADTKTQGYLKKLARKCEEGRLTEKERAEYDVYLSAIDFITVLQAKAACSAFDRSVAAHKIVVGV